MTATNTKNAAPVRRHHLDRNAAALAQSESADDDVLLNTRQLADWLNLSMQWAEIGRVKGYGPPFIKLGPRYVRYRKGDVRAWLRNRAHASTAEYQHAKVEA